jgi:hypothetical protein
MTNESLFQQALIKSVFLLTKCLENTILLTFKLPKLQGKLWHSLQNY